MQIGESGGPAVEPSERPDVRTGFISGVTFGPKAVQYQVVNGLAIFEGDCVLGTVEELEAEAALFRGETSLADLVVITGSHFRWRDGVVPWDIDTTLPNQGRVNNAINEWETRTDLSFPERTPTNAAQFPHWIRFRPGTPNCNSEVGRRTNGTPQFINLDTGCTAGNVMHEIGHAVGLWHEQSREDRDLFVTINWGNIQPGQSFNFDQHVTDSDDFGSYDYGSIMHYGPRAFGIINPTTGVQQVTITPVNPLPAGVVMGQQTALSAQDVTNVNAIYRCEHLRGSISNSETLIEQLQEQIPGASPQEKAAIFAAIKELRRDIDAAEEEAAQLNCKQITT